MLICGKFFLLQQPASEIERQRQHGTRGAEEIEEIELKCCSPGESQHYRWARSSSGRSPALTQLLHRPLSIVEITDEQADEAAEAAEQPVGADSQLSCGSLVLLELEPPAPEAETAAQTEAEAPQSQLERAEAKRSNRRRLALPKLKLARRFNELLAVGQQRLQWARASGRPSVLGRRRELMISYHRLEGQQYALDLKAALERRGLSVYLDLHEIRKGQDWQDSLNEAVRRCHCFVALVTPSYGETLWTSRELKLADLLAKHIIPVNFGQPWPPASLALQFATVQYVSWTPPAESNPSATGDIRADRDRHSPSGAPLVASGPLELQLRSPSWSRECVERVASQIGESLEMIERERANSERSAHPGVCASCRLPPPPQQHHWLAGDSPSDSSPSSPASSAGYYGAASPTEQRRPRWPSVELAASSSSSELGGSRGWLDSQAQFQCCESQEQQLQLQLQLGEEEEQLLQRQLADWSLVEPAECRSSRLDPFRPEESAGGRRAGDKHLRPGKRKSSLGRRAAKVLSKVGMRLVPLHRQAAGS